MALGIEPQRERGLALASRSRARPRRAARDAEPATRPARPAATIGLGPRRLGFGSARRPRFDGFGGLVDFFASSVVFGLVEAVGDLGLLVWTGECTGVRPVG